MRNKINPAQIGSFGINNPVIVIKEGPLRYAAVQSDGSVVCRGLELKKYYNPAASNDTNTHHSPGMFGYISNPTTELARDLIILTMENTKTGERELVCYWFKHRGGK